MVAIYCPKCGTAQQSGQIGTDDVEFECADCGSVWSVFTELFVDDSSDAGVVTSSPSRRP